ncbi:hypothetical protein DHODJN_14160 [Methylorubrum extorquens]
MPRTMHDIISLVRDLGSRRCGTERVMASPGEKTRSMTGGTAGRGSAAGRSADELRSPVDGGAGQLGGGAVEALGANSPSIAGGGMGGVGGGAGSTRDLACDPSQDEGEMAVTLVRVTAQGSRPEATAQPDLAGGAISYDALPQQGRDRYGLWLGHRSGDGAEIPLRRLPASCVTAARSLAVGRQPTPAGHVEAVRVMLIAGKSNREVVLGRKSSGQQILAAPALLTVRVREPG